MQTKVNSAVAMIICHLQEGSGQPLVMVQQGSECPHKSVCMQSPEVIFNIYCLFATTLCEVYLK
jgi:hypothetical protein